MVGGYLGIIHLVRTQNFPKNISYPLIRFFGKFCVLIKEIQLWNKVLTHFMPLVSFCTPWNNQKTFGFGTFSGDIDWQIWNWLNWNSLKMPSFVSLPLFWRIRKCSLAKSKGTMSSPSSFFLGDHVHVTVNYFSSSIGGNPFP